MWWHRGFDFTQTPVRFKKTSRFIDRDFQIRYAGVVMMAATLGTLVAFVPVSLFLNQNYRIFLDLAQQFAPALMKDLEREQIWITGLLFIGFASLTGFFLALSFRLTQRIVGPLKVIRNHLRRLSRGHWYIAPVKTRETDEFQDVVEAYNYFFESFQTYLQRDLKNLKKLNIDPQDEESYKVWRQMIEERCMQLNLKSELPFPLLTALSDESSVESPDLRRVI